MMADFDMSRLLGTPRKIRPMRRLRRVPSTSADQAIGDGLRSVFLDLPDTKLPDDWLALLDRLDRPKPEPRH